MTPDPHPPHRRRRVAFDVEAEQRPDSEYLHRHSSSRVAPDARLTAGMRRIGLGWLVEVALDQGLTQEALALAFSMLDRYMSAAKVRGARSGVGRRWGSPWLRFGGNGGVGGGGRGLEPGTAPGGLGLDPRAGGQSQPSPAPPNART